MDERESKMLRAYTSLHVSEAGNLDLSTLKGLHPHLHTAPVNASTAVSAVRPQLSCA